MAEGKVETFLLQDDGTIPNNPTLPLLIYSGVLQLGGEPAQTCRDLFRRNHWVRSWINGVYPYHHFHSTAHEVLGVIAGKASVQFGGPHGPILQIRTGDVAVIPAGVGHCNQGASSDFRVLGAYPEGQNWDLCTGQPGERPQVIDNIRRVPLPVSDPAFGWQGPLIQFWKASEANS